MRDDVARVAKPSSKLLGFGGVSRISDVFKLNIEHRLPIKTAHPSTYPRLPVAKFTVVLRHLNAHALVQHSDRTCIALPFKIRFSVTYKIAGYFFLGRFGGVLPTTVAPRFTIIARHPWGQNETLQNTRPLKRQCSVHFIRK